ncbi:MAG: roadblock/LC7 domain-containing protein [Chloroflexota bacterium]
MLPRGFDFSNKQLGQVEEVLQQLSWDTEAESILLADISGHLISVQGESDINTAVISALAAGNLAATKELARLVGEPARFKLLLHEGEQRSVYLSDVDEELLLIILFGKETPIGLVRLSTRLAIEKLLEVVKEALNNPKSEIPSFVDQADSLAEEMTNSLDDMFGNS